MTQNLQNNIILNKDVAKLVVFDLQPSKTRIGFDILSNSRLKMSKRNDELTFQEILDVKEYKSSSEKPKTFHNVNDLLQDLHE